MVMAADDRSEAAINTTATPPPARGYSRCNRQCSCDLQYDCKHVQIIVVVSHCDTKQQLKGERTRDEAVHNDTDTGTNSNDEHRSPNPIPKHDNCITDDVHINSHWIEPLDAISMVKRRRRKKHSKLEYLQDHRQDLACERTVAVESDRSKDIHICNKTILCMQRAERTFPPEAAGVSRYNKQTVGKLIDDRSQKVIHAKLATKRPAKVTEARMSACALGTPCRWATIAGSVV